MVHQSRGHIFILEPPLAMDEGHCEVLKVNRYQVKVECFVFICDLFIQVYQVCEKITGDKHLQWRSSNLSQTHIYNTKSIQHTKNKKNNIASTVNTQTEHTKYWPAKVQQKHEKHPRNGESPQTNSSRHQNASTYKHLEQLSSGFSTL